MREGEINRRIKALTSIEGSTSREGNLKVGHDEVKEKEYGKRRNVK